MSFSELQEKMDIKILNAKSAKMKKQNYGEKIITLFIEIEQMFIVRKIQKKDRPNLKEIGKHIEVVI